MGTCWHNRDNFVAGLIVAGFLIAVSPAHATVAPNTVDFGNQTVGATAGPQTVTITDTGKGPLIVASASWSLPQFSYSGPSLPLTLKPGQTMTASVFFTPTAAQTYSDILTFKCMRGPTLSVSMSGTGIISASSSSPVLAAPFITAQPVNQTVTAGQTASFSVAATGTSPLTYQWLKNGAAISGATSSSYTTPATTTSDNGAQFNVTVTNSAGSATSNTAVLTVNNPVVAPSITTQPVSQTVTAGQTATFSVAATGTSPLTFQWMMNRSAISGATSSIYTTPVTTTSNTGEQFTVAVSNSAGSATSNAATLTVNAASGQLTVNPISLSFGSVNVGSSSTLGVTLSNLSNATVTISNISLAGPGFDTSGAPTGLILAPGNTASMSVTFSPASTGSVTGSVTISSDATNSPSTISLSGSGAQSVSHSVALSWSPSTSSVVGYNVYSSTASGGPYTKLTASPVANTGYTDTNVQSGGTYYYVVTSVDSNDVESTFSNQVSATIP